MDIERQTGAPTINIPQKKLFDVCLELNKLAFPVSHRDDALFYIRPDMCIKQRDFDAMLDETGRPYSKWNMPKPKNKSDMQPRLIDEIIYIPTEDDLFHETFGTINQLTETLTSGWFAYTNIRVEEGSPEFFKGNGATPWFALADAWIQVQQWKLKSINDGQLK